MIMANEFKPNVGAKVPKADAEKWIEKFDKERKKDTRSVFFGRDVILSILAEDTTAGISFFFARKEDSISKKDADTLVMVGTTEDGTLLWDVGTTNATSANTSMGTYDNASQCPPYC